MIEYRPPLWTDAAIVILLGLLGAVVLGSAFGGSFAISGLFFGCAAGFYLIRRSAFGGDPAE